MDEILSYNSNAVVRTLIQNLDIFKKKKFVSSVTFKYQITIQDTSAQKSVNLKPGNLSLNISTSLDFRAPDENRWCVLKTMHRDLCVFTCGSGWWVSSVLLLFNDQTVDEMLCSLVLKHTTAHTEVILWLQLRLYWAVKVRTGACVHHFILVCNDFHSCLLNLFLR